MSTVTWEVQRFVDLRTLFASVGGSWYYLALPPVWFAALDDALVGTGAPLSWAVGALAVVAALGSVALASGRLARAYERGLQAVSEGGAPAEALRHRRVLDRWVRRAPLRWWLGDPSTRAAFLLTAAYMWRDRDLKLRLYPAVVPALVFGCFQLLRGHANADDAHYLIPFSVIFVCMVPQTALGVIMHSAQWQAADVFRIAPLHGAGRLFEGARRAVLLFLVLPAAVAYCALVIYTQGKPRDLALALPGLLLLPVLSLAPGLRGRAAPLSRAAAVGSRRSLVAVFVELLVVGGVSFGGATAQGFGVHVPYLLIEAVIVALVHVSWRARVLRAAWPSLDA